MRSSDLLLSRTAALAVETTNSVKTREGFLHIWNSALVHRELAPDQAPNGALNRDLDRTPDQALNRALEWALILIVLLVVIVLVCVVFVAQVVSLTCSLVLSQGSHGISLWLWFC